MFSWNICISLCKKYQFLATILSFLTISWHFWFIRLPPCLFYGGYRRVPKTAAWHRIIASLGSVVGASCPCTRRGNRGVPRWVSVVLGDTEIELIEPCMIFYGQTESHMIIINYIYIWLCTCIFEQGSPHPTPQPDGSLPPVAWGVPSNNSPTSGSVCAALRGTLCFESYIDTLWNMCR